jgi:hypothetical protein
MPIHLIAGFNAKDFNANADFNAKAAFGGKAPLL